MVYFRFPLRGLCFWLIFITLMLPVEVRIGPTYQVVASLGMINSFAGLSIPLIASATATFLFRQFFLTVPDELVEAARVDGAGPMRFFKDILLPLSKTSIAALFVIQFIYGWNQYLWPLIASATATFLFRQFFLTVPDELVEAARVDGAGPMRFFKDILVPLSRTSVAALFVIQFIYGWNQYLWPLLVTTSEDMYPVVIGIKRMLAGGDAGNEWNIVMATALLAMLPPAFVVVVMQRWFVKGLVDTEK